MEALHARSLRGWDVPAHEAGKLIQRITKGTLRATEAWTDGRHAEDDKHIELDCELAVALGQRDRRRSKSHGPEDHSDGARSWVRGMASIGRRQCAQVVERPSDSAAAFTCDAQEVQGCEGVEEKAHSVIIESCSVRAPVHND